MFFDLDWLDSLDFVALGKSTLMIGNIKRVRIKIVNKLRVKIYSGEEQQP